MFVNDTATTEMYTLSLHDALPISQHDADQRQREERGGDERAEAHDAGRCAALRARHRARPGGAGERSRAPIRSEEHTSELQSRQYLVCRPPLGKKQHAVV